MKKKSVFDNSRVYYTKFDNVQGLTTSSIVSVNGFQIGNITQIKNDPDKKWSYIIEYTLTTDLPFSENSSVSVVPPMISAMGSAELILIPSNDGTEAKSGSFLKGSTRESMMNSFTDNLLPATEKLDPLLLKIDKLINALNNTLDVSTQNNIKNSIATLNTTITNFKNASNTLNGMLSENKSKFSTILDNSSKASADLKSMTSKLEQENLVSDLKQTINNLNTSLNKFESILSQVENGNGSIGKLLKDEGLYNNLENASKEMEELLREMKEHPKRFVHFSLFGKKDKRGYVKDTISK